MYRIASAFSRRQQERISCGPVCGNECGSRQSRSYKYTVRIAVNFTWETFHV